jgi:hypothetical protein
MAYTPNTQEQQDEIVERAENNGTTSNATAKDFVKKDARGAPFGHTELNEGTGRVQSGGTIAGNRVDELEHGDDDREEVDNQL